MTPPTAASSGEAALSPPPYAPWTAAFSLLRDPYGFMTAARERYGDVFGLRLGLTRMVVFSHPNHIGHVLRGNARNYTKAGAMWDQLSTLLGNGLITSTGDHWLRQRRMMQPHFGARRLARVTDQMSEAIAEVLDRWAPRLDAPVNGQVLCPDLTMAVIVRAIFGTAIADADVRAVAEALAYALAFMLRGMALSALPDWVPAPGRARYAESLRIIDDVVYRMIERRRHEPAGDDLLSMLVALRDEESGAGMSDEEVHDEVINLFLAGYETTATGMAWAIHTIAHAPEIGQRIRGEVARVTGGAPLRFDHLAELTYTERVAKETFRMHTPAWQIMRTAQADDTIGGHHIAAGTQVMLLFCNSHRHPDFWPEPNTFDPDRFEKANSQGRHRDAWMPFGAGQRMCIGKALAMMESTLILAHICARYVPEPVPDRPPRAKLSMVLTSHDGIWVTLRPVGSTAA